MVEFSYRMRSRVSGRGIPGCGLALLLLLLLGSCAGGTVDSNHELQYLSLDRSEVFASPHGSTQQECRDLQHTLQTNQRRPGTLSRDAESACVLRLAYLHVRLGQFDQANRQLDLLFHKSPAPRSQALVLAHLLRADIYERRSNTSRAQTELAAAEKLSRDPRDRDEIDRRRHRLAKNQAPAKKPVPKPIAPAKNPWSSGAGTIVLLEREEWGSRKEVPSRLNRMTKIHRVTIHHTAMLAASTRAANTAQIRAIQRRHIGANGWGDLGYHFMIGRDGVIYEGRRLRYQGAHAGDPASNRGNIGICLLGDYSPGQQKPSAIQLRALQKLTAALCSRHRIPPAGILTHKEVRPGHGTDCPGAFLTTVVQNMRNAYRLQLAQAVD
jgi:N-acetylmuramoyl-L-alanine amidase